MFSNEKLDLKKQQHLNQNLFHSFSHIFTSGANNKWVCIYIFLKHQQQ